MFQKLVLEYFKSKTQWVANTQPNSNWHICLIQKHYLNWEWWHMSLITTHFRKIPEDPFEFKAILVYITSSRTMDYVKRSCLKTKFKKVSSGGHEHLCLGEVEVVGAQTWVMWGWIYSVSQMPMDWKFAYWSICLPHAHFTTLNMEPSKKAIKCSLCHSTRALPENKKKIYMHIEQNWRAELEVLMCRGHQTILKWFF